MDLEKIDEATLALLYLGISETHPMTGTRAWKSFDWATLSRLHEKGMIFDPVGKAISVRFSEDGLKVAKDAFVRLFGDNE